MSLIACAECGHQISSRAKACPQCGAPVAADARRGVVTTQQTGKLAKLQQALAVVLMIVGVVLFAGGDTQRAATGGMLMIAGLIWWLGARVWAWWRHG